MKKLTLVILRHAGYTYICAYLETVHVRESCKTVVLARSIFQEVQCMVISYELASDKHVLKFNK